MGRSIKEEKQYNTTWTQL